MKELALLCVRRKELILMLVNYTQVTPRDDLPYKVMHAAMPLLLRGE